MNSKHHVKIKNKSNKKKIVLVVKNSELLSISRFFVAGFGQNVQILGDFFEITSTILLMMIL